MTEAASRDRSAPRARGRFAAVAATVILLATPVAGRASGFGPMGGHLSLGYGQLMISGAPGGSISFTAGVELPVRPTFKAGIDLGYALLGSSTVDRGSLSANVSYSAFEAVAFAHWLPRHLGPVGRVSVGPLLMAAHADISAAAGGAGFGDLAVGGTAPGLAGEVTLISRSNLPSGSAPPVRVGLQLGGHVGFVRHETWTLLSARLTFHY